LILAGKGYPDILDAYLRYRILSKLEEDGIDAREIAGQVGVEVDEKEILRLLLEDLDARAIIHFTDANWRENACEATVPLWDALRERMVGMTLEEEEVWE